jgi:23S rRNA pseudouridine2605 synthase
MKQLRAGLLLDDGPVKPTFVKVMSTGADRTLIKITLHEGRQHIVRRTMDAVGHPVRRMSRIGIGPVRLGRLKVGDMRDLTREELGGLLDLTSEPT